MKLLVALTAELGLLIAAWAYLGEIVRGSDASTVTLYVNGYIAAFLTVTEMLVAIAFSMIAVYWIPVLIGEIVDVRARSGNVKKSATFPISPFTVGIYIFILCCKIMLAGLSTVMIAIVSNNLASAVLVQDFAADLTVLNPLADATTTVGTTLTLLAVLTAFLVLELFLTVHSFGWEQAKAKYGVVKK